MMLSTSINDFFLQYSYNILYPIIRVLPNPTYGDFLASRSATFLVHFSKQSDLSYILLVNFFYQTD